MTATRLAPSPNGSKPSTAPRVVPLLGPTIDHLLELRALIRRAQEQERQMTADIIRAMEGAGVSRLDGGMAVAVLEQRTNLHPDPELFLQAVGARAYAALTVSVTAARKLIGADDLDAISETTVSPVLRVESLERGGAA